MIFVKRASFTGALSFCKYYIPYNDNYSMVELQGDPDLSLIAAAYGMDYAKVDGNSDVEAELKKFLKDDKSALMEVCVDPMELTGEK